MKTAKRARVPILLCEVCAWAFVRRYGSCQVQHCDEAVIQQSFYSGRSPRRSRSHRRSETKPAVPELSCACDGEESTRVLEQHAPARDVVNGGHLEGEHPRRPVATFLGESSSNNEGPHAAGSAAEPGEPRGTTHLHPAIEELPAYLEETAARLFELENNLCDVPKMREQLSVLKERHKRLRQQLANRQLN